MATTVLHQGCVLVEITIMEFRSTYLSYIHTHLCKHIGTGVKSSMQAVLGCSVVAVK